jgi:peptidyl-prolyl cis-trans isomerase D
MLQKIRDNASGPLAYAVVALIALVFGVWGIGSYFTPSANPAVASVGGTKITRNQLQQAYNQHYARLRQLLGKHFDPSQFPPKKIKQQVLEGLIDRAVLSQYAQSAGYRVTDADLLAVLRSNPQFQENGHFSPKHYKALLAAAGLQPARYEASLRKSIQSAEIRQEITRTAFAAAPEVDHVYRLAHQQRRVHYLIFDPAAYKDPIVISDAEIKKYYQQHPQQFMRPARVKLAYVALDKANAASSGSPSQKTLRAIYKQNKAQLGTPEKRSGEAIKVPIHKKNNAAARQTIQAVAAKVKSGQSFQAVAQATKGVKYHPVDASTQNQLPKTLGKALFGLHKGQSSSPVKGDHAWYLVKLNGVTPAKTPPFKAPKMQARLRAIAQAKQQREAYRQKSKQMDNLAYQAPNSLKTLAQKLNLPIQHSGWISKNGGSGIGQYDAIRKAAFSDSVRKDHLNSTVISLGDNRKVVLRVAAAQPAKRRPLAAVKKKIHNRLVTRKADDKAQAAAQQAMRQLASGQSMTALAKKLGVSLKSPGYIGRSTDDVDPHVLAHAFSLPAPKNGQPSTTITPTTQGTTALVAVSAVREPNAAQDKKAKAQRQQLAQRQQNYVAGLEYAALNRYLRSQADVSINRDQLQ